MGTSLRLDHMQTHRGVAFSCLLSSGPSIERCENVEESSNESISGDQRLTGEAGATV